MATFVGTGEETVREDAEVRDGGQADVRGGAVYTVATMAKVGVLTPLPMDLCHEPDDWHTWIRQLLLVARTRPNVDTVAILHDYVAAELGADVLDTHDWSYTPGSGAALRHLIASVMRSKRGAVLPVYQGVAKSLCRGTTQASLLIDPTDWAGARFTPPQIAPEVLVVNPLHANPLASTLPDTFRFELAKYARDVGVLVIEDDPFRGTGTEDRGISTLLSAHPGGVVYLGSWTKILGWPVKLGFVGRPRTHPQAAQLISSIPAPPYAQVAVLAAVLMSGITEVILRRRRARLARRRAEVVQVLSDRGFGFVPPTGGTHVCLVSDGCDLLLQVLRAERIGGLDWRHFYPQDCPAPPSPFVRLGISNVADVEWPGLVARLERALDSLRTPVRFPNPLQSEA